MSVNEFVPESDCVEVVYGDMKIRTWGAGVGISGKSDMSVSFRCSK